MVGKPRRKKTWLLLFAFLVLLIGSANQPARLFFDQPGEPVGDPGAIPEPQPEGEPVGVIPKFPAHYRYLYIKNQPVRSHWVLTEIPGSAENCQIYRPDSEAPKDEDILGYCGLAVYQEWTDQAVCLAAGEAGCSKMSLAFISSIESKLETPITLPGPVAYVQSDNCPVWGFCSQKPQLTFGGIEPLKNYAIDTVYVYFEGHPVKKCTELPCNVEVPLTDERGIKVVYYAVSSYGDRSWSQEFVMRNLAGYRGGYLFQAMGDPWWSSIPAGPAQWEVFPAPNMLDVVWLQEADQMKDLNTAEDLSLLAGKLILRGTVSAANCPYGGLLENGAANACGDMAARQEVVRIQNQFNDQIWEAARVSRVPPRLLKGLIVQESQFWNGWVIKGEFGYGMMTENGADMLLTWNLPYFLNLCVPVYGTDACAWGYSMMGDFPKAYLRGLAIQKVGTENEFFLLGQTLSAAAGQTGQLIRNITSQQAGRVVDYDQMWMISLAVYNGGAGCVGTAINAAWGNGEDLTWANISEYLPGDCQAIADYPQKVVQFSD